MQNHLLENSRAINKLQDIVERTSNDVKILACKGEVAYQLELPEALSAVHNVFHPDMVGAPLRDTVPLEEVQLESALTYAYDGA
jgi:hypothetical protein